jgi:hypothetical protein
MQWLINAYDGSICLYEELINCFGTITFNDDGTLSFIQTVAASDNTMQGILLTTRIGA